MIGDYYAILGVSCEATQEEIDAAYKRLAKALHPDVNVYGAALMQTVNEAHDVLSDAAKRAAHDRAGRVKNISPQAEKSAGSAASFVGQDGTVNVFAIAGSFTPESMQRVVLPLVGEVFARFGLNAEKVNPADVVNIAAGRKPKRRKRARPS